MGIEALTLANKQQMIGGTLRGRKLRIVTSITSPEAPCYGSISPLWEKKLIPHVHPEAVLLTNKGGSIKTGREWKLKTQEERL